MKIDLWVFEADERVYLATAAPDRATAMMKTLDQVSGVDIEKIDSHAKLEDYWRAFLEILDPDQFADVVPVTLTRKLDA
jgi:hypothetical protein